MAIVTTRAITLKRTDFSETSQILTFLTVEHGIITALARGSRRPKSDFGGPIDLLSLNEIVFYEKRSGLYSLAEADLVTNFPGIRTRISRTYGACYACELIYCLARDAQHPKELFDLLHRTLYTIERSNSLRHAVFAFEIEALAVAGYLPQFDQCVSCGGPLEEKAEAQFGPLLGGLLCDGCSAGAANTVAVAAGAISIARALAGGISRPERLRIAPQQAVDLRALLDRFIETILSTRLKSRKFLQRI